MLAFVADGNYLLIVVLGLALLDGSLAITARGLTRGAVGALMQPAGLLREANGLLNVGFAAAAVGGAALAGLMVTEFSLSVVLAADAASFLVIAVVIGRTSGLACRRDRAGELARAIPGWPGLRKDQFDRATAAGGPKRSSRVLHPRYPDRGDLRTREPRDNQRRVRAAVAAWGLGIVLGSLCYLLIRSARPLILILGSTAAVGLAYCGMSIANTLAIACLFAILGGAGNGVQWVAVVTGLQEATPIDLQARVVGLLESLGAAMPGVGFLLGAIITTVTSPRTAYAVAGIGVLALVLLAIVMRRFVFVRSTPLGTNPHDEPEELVVPEPTRRTPKAAEAPPHP